MAVSLFETHCKDGKFECAKKEYSYDLLHANNDYAFRWATRKNHVEIVRWLYKKFSPGYKFNFDTNKLLATSAIQGHLDSVKFLYNNKIATDLLYNDTLKKCIKGDKPSIVKYIYGKYDKNVLIDLSLPEDTWSCNTVYENCLKRKQYDLLKWFILDSGIVSRTDICKKFPEMYLFQPNLDCKELLQIMNIYRILNHICIHHDYETLMKVVKSYGSENKLPVRSNMLSLACKNGKCRIVEWLINNYPVDIHYQEEQPFRYAVKNGFLSIAKILWEKSNKSINIHAKEEQAFRLCCSNNHFSVAKWLLSLSDTIDFHAKNDEVYLYGARNSEIRKILPDTSLVLRDSRFASIIRKKQLRFVLSYYLPNEESVYWKHPDVFFVSIPKTGTQSISSKVPCHTYLGHLFANKYPQSVRHKLKTIVRNPYSRLTSAYFFMLRGGFFDTDLAHELIILYPTFEEFVLNWLEQKYTKYDICEYEMFIAQIEYVIDDDRQIILDSENIGRFENLKEDTKKLFNIDGLPHFNSNNSGDWKQYYKNKDVRDKVYDLYKEDFIAFGYDKEIVL